MYRYRLHIGHLIYLLYLGTARLSMSHPRDSSRDSCRLRCQGILQRHEHLIIGHDNYDWILGGLILCSQLGTWRHLARLRLRCGPKRTCCSVKWLRNLIRQGGIAYGFPQHHQQRQAVSRRCWDDPNLHMAQSPHCRTSWKIQSTFEYSQFFPHTPQVY